MRIRRLLGHQLAHVGLNDLGPNLIPLFVGVEQVGHDGLGQIARVIEEGGADIEIANHGVGGQIGDEAVGLFQLLADFD